MAFRLKKWRAPKSALQRIARKQLRRAADEVKEARQRGEAVHEARKRVKKIRAVLHLLHASLGRDYRHDNTALRSIAHQLSARRDADAAVEMVQAIQKHFPALVTTPMADALRQRLQPEQRRASSRLRPECLERELRKAARSVPRHLRRAAGPEDVESGVARGYRRARRAMRAVEDQPEDAGFHLWRRRIKDHWYQVRLLEAGQPGMQRRVKSLKRLERLLGDDHNLVLLRETLLEDSATFGEPRNTAILLGCILKYQAVVRARALALGKGLFRRKPRTFAHIARRALGEG